MSSVTKSAAGKAVNAGKEAGSELLENSGEALEKLKEKGEELGGQVKTKAADIWEKAVEKVEDFGEKALDKAEDLGQKIKESEIVDRVKDKATDLKEKITESDVFDKVKTTTEDIGKKVIDTGKKIGQEVQETISPSSKIKSDNPVLKEASDTEASANEFVDNIKEKAADFKDEMVEKAKNTIGNIDDKIDEISAKADEMKKMEASKPEFKKMPDQLGKSELEGKDDFFAKASAYADGNYSGVADDPIIERVELPVEDTTVSADDPLPGFEDRDGDGNELVDDAIIDEGSDDPDEV